MLKGKFIEYFLNEPDYSKLIKKIDKEFYIFIKECFICDLIMNYNETGINEEIASADIIKIYYSILQKHENLLADNLKEIVVSNGQKKYQVINRNVFTSNSNHSNGLQNRSELSCKIENKSSKEKKIIYKLSKEFINLSHFRTLISFWYFNEHFSYLDNFNNLFMPYYKCACCSTTEHILMVPERIPSINIPLPFYDDLKFMCFNCAMENNDLNYMNSKGDKDGNCK